MHDWLVLVYKRHNEWIQIVKSLGEKNYAEDIVQEAYITLIKYASKEKVIYNGVVSRGYMFFTLRNLYYNYYNQKFKIKKVSIDEYNLNLYDDSNLDEQKAFYKICKMIDQEVNKWHYYDANVFNFYRHTDLSIRGVAKEIDVNWMSIFLLLKTSKKRIYEIFKEDYEDYKNQDYDKI